MLSIHALGPMHDGGALSFFTQPTPLCPFEHLLDELRGLLDWLVDVRTLHQIAHLRR